MKKINDINENTQFYWNDIYGDKAKREQYTAQGTSIGHGGGEIQKPTYRFEIAVSEVGDGEKVVDMGCGVGVFTRLVKTIHPNCEVWGTDISDQACTDNTHENPHIKYLCQFIGQQNLLPDDYFDFVFSGEVLEHLDVPEDLFKDAYRVLKKGGRFLVTTPHTDHVRSNEHVWEFTHEDVEKLFLEAGFSKIRFIYLPKGEHFFVIMAIGIK